PAILGECESTGGVSVMTTEALGGLLSVMADYRYELDHPDVLSVFTTIEMPDDELRRIEELRRPYDSFDFGLLLERIWEEQEERQDGRDVSITDLYRRFYEVEGGLEDEDELQLKLQALQVLAFPRVQFNSTKERVALRQAPHQIIAQIEAVMRRKLVEARD